MDERRVRGTIIAVLAVLGALLVAVAATPLFTLDQGDRQAPHFEIPQQNRSGEPPSSLSSAPIEPIVSILLVLGGILIAVQFVSDPWETLKQLVGVILVTGILLAILWLILSSFNVEGGGTPPARPPPNTATPTAQDGGFGSGTSDPYVLPVDAIAIVILLAGLLGTIALVAWRSGMESLARVFGTVDDTADSGSDLETIGTVAGETADRVEAASTPQAADNAIYRAWSEMVALVGTSDPQSATPRQFESDAVAMGMDADDVRVLTRIFEAVRYGDASLTPERRERALDAFRRIEARHGEPQDGVDSSRSADVGRNDGGRGGGGSA